MPAHKPVHNYNTKCNTCLTTPVPTGVVQFVRRAFEDALSRILNKRQVDVLADIARARERGRPYVIVFCGVNGVGKSTNLAKIAYWLGQQGCSVLLAACDTFRAGAVEQLKTHAARLGVSESMLLLSTWLSWDSLFGMDLSISLPLPRFHLPCTVVAAPAKPHARTPAKPHRCPCMSAAMRRTLPRWQLRQCAQRSVTAATLCWSTPRGVCRCAVPGAWHASRL